MVFLGSDRLPDVNERTLELLAIYVESVEVLLQLEDFHDGQRHFLFLVVLLETEGRYVAILAALHAAFQVCVVLILADVDFHVLAVDEAADELD